MVSFCHNTHAPLHSTSNEHYFYFIYFASPNANAASTLIVFYWEHVCISFENADYEGNSKKMAENLENKNCWMQNWFAYFCVLRDWMANGLTIQLLWAYGLMHTYMYIQRAYKYHIFTRTHNTYAQAESWRCATEWSISVEAVGNNGVTRVSVWTLGIGEWVGCVS